MTVGKVGFAFCLRTTSRKLSLVIRLTSWSVRMTTLRCSICRRIFTTSDGDDNSNSRQINSTRERNESRSFWTIIWKKIQKQSFYQIFFFRGTFHNMFQTGHTLYLWFHRYQWKKLPKPPWGFFVFIPVSDTNCYVIISHLLLSWPLFLSR